MYTQKRDTFHDITQRLEIPTVHLFGDYWMFRLYSREQKRFSWWLLVKLVDK